jgi:hypothetical protein
VGEAASEGPEEAEDMQGEDTEWEIEHLYPMGAQDAAGDEEDTD